MPKIKKLNNCIKKISVVLLCLILTALPSQLDSAKINAAPSAFLNQPESEFYGQLLFPVELNANNQRYRIDQNSLFGAELSDGNTSTGIDICDSGNVYADIYGKAVLATYKGIVIKIEKDKTWNGNDEDGNYVLLCHYSQTGKIYTKYSHLQSVSSYIYEGMIVTQSTVIGYVGNTGNVTPSPVSANDRSGAKLHFEVLTEDGDGTLFPLNPELFLQFDQNYTSSRIVGTISRDISVHNGQKCTLKIEMYIGLTTQLKHTYKAFKLPYLYTANMYYNSACIYYSEHSYENFVISDINMEGLDTRALLLLVSGCNCIAEKSKQISVIINSNNTTYISIK